ncbi:MAG: hypothetical protein OJF51_005174 [Nitrospira sp.]|jgi:hypothetical protein|nr:MAG: hypothetical protein OJF51_005174 [Nitrospira sp.]
MFLVCFGAVTMFGVAQLSERIERNIAGEKAHEGLAGGA